MHKTGKYLKSIIYIISIIFWTSIILGLMKDDNTSFFTKISQSPSFAVKFICLEIAILVGLILFEWTIFKWDLLEKIHLRKIQEMKIVRFFSKYVSSYLIYLLAVIVVILNISLMFDNVVWGDEAFSANTAKNSLYGVIEILYYCDNHPPLHYIWIKLFGDIFGHSIPVYHLASLVPFIIGIILVVTVVRKEFGNIPACFFVVISGLGASCLEYNLEIRMYSLAFLGVLGAFYCSYRVICTGKKSAWIGMVLWALEAAYSHYYALVAVGVMLFFTGIAVWIKNGGKYWIKGLAAIIVFLIGYAPWLYFLFTAIKNISGNWWMTDILGLNQTIEMIMGYKGLSACIFPIVLVLLVILLIFESKLIKIETVEGKNDIVFNKPSIKGWSNEMYAIVVGVATIIGTVAFAYFLSYAMKPMLAQRYMYPLSAVTFIILVVELNRIFALTRKYEEKIGKKTLRIIVKGFALAFLSLFLVIGIDNYKNYRAVAIDQDNKTKATLNLIGEPGDDTMFVTNGVKHLGWTIFPCYFPETEFVNANCYGATKDKFWYFNPVPITEEEQMNLAKAGYEIISYGQMQISQYPFFLYYVER